MSTAQKVFLLFNLSLFLACGVKGPPLPPIPSSAEQSDKIIPTPTVTPSPKEEP